MVENIDYNMGRLLVMVDEWGLAENTFLIFMTDNGKALSADRGRHDGQAVQQYNAGMHGYKGSTYEGGTHVPFFIRWPGMLKAYEAWWSESRPLMVNECVPMSEVKPYHEKYYKQLEDEGIIPWQKPEL